MNWKFAISSLSLWIIEYNRYDGLHHGSSYLEHLNFLSAVKDEFSRSPAVDLQDGLFSVAIGVAAQLSIEKGRFVSINEVIEDV